MISDFRPVALTLAVGAVGALLADAVSLPAAALVGSAIAVSVAASLKLPVGMNSGLRNLAFAAIGVSLGAGVDGGLAADLGNWVVSLALLLVSVAATLLAAAWVLQRGFGADRDTALLGSCPGTMSYAMAMALEGRGDATVVVVLQVIRVLSLVTIVPLLAAFGGVTGGTVGLGVMAPVPLALVLAVSLALGLLGLRLNVPAACLLTGMIVSGAAHAAGLTSGAAPGWMIAAAFLVTGATMGTRLRAIRPAELLHMAGAAFAVIGVAVLVSLGFAAVTTALTGLPFGQVWTAFAPGGVEAMAAIGLALGYDPAYVAAHHFARILFLVLFLPVCLGTAPARE